MNSSCTRLFLEPLKTFLFSQPQKAIYLHILIFCLSINSIMFQVILLSMLSYNENETIQHMGNYRLHHEYKLQALFEVYRIPHCIIEYANASKSDFIVNDRCSAIFAFFGGKLRFVSGSVANPNSDPIRFV